MIGLAGGVAVSVGVSLGVTDGVSVAVGDGVRLRSVRSWPFHWDSPWRTA